MEGARHLFHHTITIGIDRPVDARVAVPEAVRHAASIRGPAVSVGRGLAASGPAGFNERPRQVQFGV